VGGVEPLAALSFRSAGGTVPRRGDYVIRCGKRDRIATIFLLRRRKNGTLFLLKKLLQKRPQISCGLITVGISTMFR
jgi:hypothetical protein